MKKKIALMVTSLVLVVAMAVGGTLAYLTATTQVVENTFTVGNVTITLDEARTDAYGAKDGDERTTTGNEYKLIPGHQYVKDPTIYVSEGSEDCYLYVQVKNGLSAYEKEGNTTIAKQMEAKGWVLIEGSDSVYYQENPYSASGKQVVFDTFTIGDVSLAGAAEKTITIKAYAIQKDTFTSATEAWAAAAITT